MTVMYLDNVLHTNYVNHIGNTPAQKIALLEQVSNYGMKLIKLCSQLLQFLQV